MRDFIATVVLILFLVHIMKLMLRKVAVRWIAVSLVSTVSGDSIRSAIVSKHEAFRMANGSRDITALLESTRRISVITPVAASVGKMFALGRPLVFSKREGEGFDDLTNCKTVDANYFFSIGATSKMIFRFFSMKIVI